MFLKISKTDTEILESSILEFRSALSPYNLFVTSKQNGDINPSSMDSWHPKILQLNKLKIAKALYSPNQANSTKQRFGVLGTGGTQEKNKVMPVMVRWTVQQVFFIGPFLRSPRVHEDAYSKV